MSIKGTTPVFNSERLDNKQSTEFLQTSNILQNTGQSTTDTMSQKAITDALNNVSAGLDASEIINLIYPIGSIYISTVNTNPGTLFGIGTWERYGNGKALVGVDESDSNFNSVEKSGGSSNITLTTDQIPSHTHTFKGKSVRTGNQSASHNHGFSTGQAEAISGLNYYSAAGGGVWYTSVVGGSGGTSGPISGNQIPGGNHRHSGTTGNQSASHTHTVTASGTNSSTGGGKSHSNLQPYITCYIWKRTE